MAKLERVRVVPVDGSKVIRMPRAPFERIPAEGKIVRKEPYWLRRERDGDIEILDLNDEVGYGDFVQPDPE